jgi:hypothetical protein
LRRRQRPPRFEFQHLEGLRARHGFLLDHRRGIARLREVVPIFLAELARTNRGAALFA